MGDWDRKPREAQGIWLRLKAKKDEARIRIASAPYREVQVWPTEKGGKRLDQSIVNALTPGQWLTIMRDPTWQVSETYYLLVIDRSDGQAKIFQTSGAVYSKIRDYAMNKEWGNPMGYDITIERTEDPGKSYWKVTPSPNKSSLLAGELELAETLIDKLSASTLPASDPQPDDVADGVDPQPLPWQSAAIQPEQPRTVAGDTPVKLPADWVDTEQEPDVVDPVFSDNMDDGPINLDDIPM